MTETKQVQPGTETREAVVRTPDFWTRYNKPILYAAAAIILLGAGYLAYKYLYKQPQEQKAAEMMFKAEEFYRQDSLRLALNGSGTTPGFVKVISQYGGTEAGELARFYAGDSYLRLGDFKNAEKYLEDFDTDSKPVQARAYKLLADAYAEQGKNKEALEHYRKAAGHFTADEQNASEYLFLAAYFAENVVKNREQAIDLYKQLKEKYPRSQRGFEADKYLARLGVYNTK
ncbi:MAG TPA: tetratricopeptide repeat protein [Chitinophagaceae bacterium]|jgi:tetratricopeptide (TPR) repeat protein|nr:tetratricopeptide repeat protein [Chitinophagaceae bacterium]